MYAAESIKKKTLRQNVDLCTQITFSHSLNDASWRFGHASLIFIVPRVKRYRQFAADDAGERILTSAQQQLRWATVWPQ